MFKKISTLQYQKSFNSPFYKISLTDIIISANEISSLLYNIKSLEATVVVICCCISKIELNLMHFRFDVT